MRTFSKHSLLVITPCARLSPANCIHLMLSMSALHNFCHQMSRVQRTKDFHRAAKEVEPVTFLCKSVLFPFLEWPPAPTLTYYCGLESHSPEPLWDSSLSFSLLTSSPTPTHYCGESPPKRVGSHPLHLPVSALATFWTQKVPFWACIGYLFRVKDFPEKSIFT